MTKASCRIAKITLKKKINNNDKRDHYHRCEFKPRLGGGERENATVRRVNRWTVGKRENATVSRVNRGTREEGERENAAVSRVNRGTREEGEEGECHSEQGKQWRTSGNEEKYNRRAELGNATWLTAVKREWERWESIIRCAERTGKKR